MIPITKHNIVTAQYNSYRFLTNRGDSICKEYPTCKEAIFIDIDEYEEDIEDFEFAVITKEAYLNKTLELWRGAGLPELKEKRRLVEGLAVLDFNLKGIFKHYAFIDLFVMCVKSAILNVGTLKEGISVYSKKEWDRNYKVILDLSNNQLKKINNQYILDSLGFADLDRYPFEEIQGWKKLRKNKLTAA